MDNELKNSEQYISKYASKKSGFSSPKDYFDSVEDSFSARLSEQLLPKNNGFKTPDSYFDDLENVILNKVGVLKAPKVISLRRRIIKMIPVAAAAAVALFIGLNFFTIEKEVTSEEIATWFENDIYRISSDDISVIFEDVDLSDEETDTPIDLDEIESYLENIDTTPLLNEIN